MLPASVTARKPVQARHHLRCEATAANSTDNRWRSRSTSSRKRVLKFLRWNPRTELQITVECESLPSALVDCSRASLRLAYHRVVRTVPSRTKRGLNPIH